jgi:hypothetical protein
MMQAIHKQREIVMQNTTEKLYYPVALFWSKGKDSKVVRWQVLDNVLPMTHKECMAFISKFSNYPGRTFTIQESVYHFVGFDD